MWSPDGINLHEFINSDGDEIGREFLGVANLFY